MTGTTINGALEALVGLWDAGTPDTLQVRDGGPIIDARRDWLAVGFDASRQTGAIAAAAAPGDAGLNRDRETYDIANLLGTWDGNKTLAQSRTEAFAYFTTLKAIVRANLNLGVSGVMRATVGPYVLDQDTSTLGNAVTLSFIVHVEAFA